MSPFISTRTLVTLHTQPSMGVYTLAWFVLQLILISNLHKSARDLLPCAWQFHEYIVFVYLDHHYDDILESRSPIYDCEVSSALVCVANFNLTLHKSDRGLLLCACQFHEMNCGTYSLFISNDAHFIPMAELTQCAPLVISVLLLGQRTMKFTLPKKELRILLVAFTWF